MTAGIIVRNGAGIVIVDNSTFMGRYLGQVAVGAGAGSLTDDRLTLGTPWAIPILDNTAPFDSSTSSNVYAFNVFAWLTAPSWAVSGNVLQWTRPATSTLPSSWTYPSCTLIYGIR